MEQTVKICYKISFPFGRCTNCMFQNLSINKTEKFYKFSVVLFDNVILESESHLLGFLYALMFRKQRKSSEVGSASILT